MGQGSGRTDNELIVDVLHGWERLCGNVPHQRDGWLGELADRSRMPFRALDRARRTRNRIAHPEPGNPRAVERTELLRALDIIGEAERNLAAPAPARKGAASKGAARKAAAPTSPSAGQRPRGDAGRSARPSKRGAGAQPATRTPRSGRAGTPKQRAKPRSSATSRGTTRSRTPTPSTRAARTGRAARTSAPGGRRPRARTARTRPATSWRARGFGRHLSAGIARIARIGRAGPAGRAALVLVGVLVAAVVGLALLDLL
jgi:hypothetical protein